MLPVSLYLCIFFAPAFDGYAHLDVYGNYGELWPTQISTKLYCSLCFLSWSAKFLGEMRLIEPLHE